MASVKDQPSDRLGRSVTTSPESITAAFMAIDSGLFATLDDNFMSRPKRSAAKKTVFPRRSAARSDAEWCAADPGSLHIESLHIEELRVCDDPGSAVHRHGASKTRVNALMLHRIRENGEQIPKVIPNARGLPATHGFSCRPHGVRYHDFQITCVRFCRKQRSPRSD
jgi:hypothetical protein